MTYPAQQIANEFVTATIDYVEERKLVADLSAASPDLRDLIEMQAHYVAILSALAQVLQAERNRLNPASEILWGAADREYVEAPGHMVEAVASAQLSVDTGYKFILDHLAVEPMPTRWAGAYLG